MRRIKGRGIIALVVMITRPQCSDSEATSTSFLMLASAPSLTLPPHSPHKLGQRADLEVPQLGDGDGHKLALPAAARRRVHTRESPPAGVETEVWSHGDRLILRQENRRLRPLLPTLMGVA